MKKILFLILSSFIVLGACGNNDSEKKEDNKSSEYKKSNDPKKDKKSDDKKDNSTEEQNTSNVDEKNNEKQNNQNDNEQNIQDNSSSEKSQNTQNVDITNIKDRSTLESVIYGNYSETTKIQAYNSAVANGVIPQGNVMEGPASAAYESSLRVESGQEKSVYDNYSSSNSSSGTDKASQSQNNEPDEWVKGQEEWANATQSEKEEIRKRDAEKYGYKYDPNDYEE
ncbi:hypothetical protein LZT70_09370 [Staphylococcus epidermidis]|uniref:hypothetical protein n=1 Tax=Staphylococcus epidermidis TaxID=1282 RepID=UPI002094277D|nr:hypothetical protein [Staphylococcus epidermidis]MCO6218430.1 hypothetical protein [Staphylococcus epidermidis]